MSSFALKLIAIVAMTCNHAAYIFAAELPQAAYCALIGIGGFTFPTMAFLLVEGYKHTSSVKNYAIRLGAFALVSQIPYALFLGPVGNVLFTLLASLLILYALDHLDGAARIAAVAGLFCASALCDWGLVGPVLVALLWQADREQRKPLGTVAAIAAVLAAIAIAELVLQGGPASSFALSQLIFAAGCFVSGFALCRYNGQRGKPLKYFFYAYYPVHIAVLGMIHLAAFGTFPSIL